MSVGEFNVGLFREKNLVIGEKIICVVVKVKGLGFFGLIFKYCRVIDFLVGDVKIGFK